MAFSYDSLASLIEAAHCAQKPISQLVLEQQAQQKACSEQAICERMAAEYKIMVQAVHDGTAQDLRSASGLTGGSAYRMQQYVSSGRSLCGSVFGNALTSALAVAELNSAMGRIVAAPTAGSCGILPAAVFTLQQARGLSEHRCVMALLTASGVGMVIARNACLAGAQGGCQAECGSASAMAAAALVELAGGTPEMVGNAVAIAFKNVLGLVCDPVAGLVEIPCIKRNASGVANAFVAAELALAGIASAIPADEVILAMKQIGDSMCPALKETAEGGLAATPTARRLYQQVFGNA